MKIEAQELQVKSGIASRVLQCCEFTLNLT